MLNMGNGLTTSAECYDCVREMVFVFEELAKVQALAIAGTEADIDTAGNAFQRRAEAFVLRLAENFGVTVSNEDIVVAEEGEFYAPGEVSANQAQR